MINQPLSITLDFSDIYSFGKLKDLKTALETGGVYIWGFVFQKENGNPTGIPLDNNIPYDPINHCFIPYYVGKSNDNMYGRLAGSHNKAARDLYLVLNYDYLLEFYKTSKNPTMDFPDMLGEGPNKPRDWYTKSGGFFKNKIVYYNNKQILEDVYSSKLKSPLFPSKGNSYPLSHIAPLIYMQKNEYFSIHPFSNHYFQNKQYFTYASINCNSLNYEWLEAYIFYLLKGKTVSQHKGFPFLLYNKDVCVGSVLVTSNLTYVKTLFKEEISTYFPGY